MNQRFFPDQTAWSLSAAKVLLDMSGGRDEFHHLGEGQLRAAVSLHRMILEHGVAYLADEVGMGKTYVALAVVALFRHLQPGFRVLYLTPSRNVMGKWHERELPAFVRENVNSPEMRVKGPAGLSPALSVACADVDSWLNTCVEAPTVLDTFLTFSALSFALGGNEEDWKRRVRQLATLAGVTADLTGVKKKDTFKERAARIANETIPTYDLVVIDEAHLLKSGAGPDASDRNRFLAAALGSLVAGTKRRFRGALLLSATPFDRDLEQLARQLELLSPQSGKEAPHSVVRQLATAPRIEGDWAHVHQGLKPFLVRRLQKLPVGGRELSRNQYRVEHRAGAGISLKDQWDQETIKQRIFTAIVQKRLTEHLDNQNQGKFPLAMFSSWEAYSPNKKTIRSNSKKAPVQDEQGGSDVFSGELDLADERHASDERSAVDSPLLKAVIDSHRELFHVEPPHPKLEREASRIAEEIFSKGAKQLVFVRRLKSVDDLYFRLNQHYDLWLARHLDRSQVLSEEEWIRVAKKHGSLGTEPVEADGTNGGTIENDAIGDDPPASQESLFSWFFRGKLDAAGERFINAKGLPKPELLRSRLRDPERMESLIGELDWIGFVAFLNGGLLVVVSDAELAEAASKIHGERKLLDRYRRLQLAWCQVALKKISGKVAKQLRPLERYLEQLVGGPNAAPDKILEKDVRRLLSVETLPLALYRRGHGGRTLPLWKKVWEELEDASDESAAQKLRELDLHREVLFTLLRLSHPFIDLYIAWVKCENRDSPKTVANYLVSAITQLFEVSGRQFGTVAVIEDLADGWFQIAKTNFSEFLKGADRLQRDDWRRKIQQLLSPFSPVEWASGLNTDARSAIARRFRMPGYPLALVATSVLQEGEDLHVCCDRVTHFGITGSPIGIEQKNGRVDRIGSLAQRQLNGGLSVEEAGIQVRFPHLVESLEWYQIRDLSHNLNDYLRSMHHLEKSGKSNTRLLGEVVADRSPIPELLEDRLHSPFEPEIEPLEMVTSAEAVTERFAEVKEILVHARDIVARIGAQYGFYEDPEREDCFVSKESSAEISIRPSHVAGELAIHGWRRIPDHEDPSGLGECPLRERLENIEWINTIGSQVQCQYGLYDTDKGLELRVSASCFARSAELLDEEEVLDLMARVGISVEATCSLPGTTDRGLSGLIEEAFRDKLICREFALAGKQSLSMATLVSQRKRNIRMTLRVRGHWLEIDRVLEETPEWSAENLRKRTLVRNAKHSVTNYYLDSKSRICVRAVQPIAFLHPDELLCLLREIAAVPE